MRTFTIAALMLISTAAYAQSSQSVTTTQPQPGPVLQAVTDDASTNRVDVEIGAVRVTTHNTRYTVAYLPFLAPLPGTAFRPSMEMPNALALTSTSIPQRPRTRIRTLVDIR